MFVSNCHLKKILNTWLDNQEDFFVICEQELTFPTDITPKAGLLKSWGLLCGIQEVLSDQVLRTS